MILLLGLPIAPASAARYCRGRRATIVGDETATSIYGTRGNDVIVTSDEDDFVDAGRGDDIVCAAGGRDRVEGGPGDDQLDGSGGIDLLSGGPGQDDLWGGPSLDTMGGGPGPDRMSGGNYQDLLIGDGGNDTYLGGPGADVALFNYLEQAVSVDLARGTARGQGRDRLSSITGIVGSPRADVLVGDDRSNLLSGYGGDDVLRGRGGRDIASFSFLEIGVQVDLASGTASGQGDERLSGFEVITGSTEADQIRGDGRRNVIDGVDGEDHLLGRGGDDLLRAVSFARLTGGPGDDVLEGGTADYSHSPRPVRVDLAAGRATGEGHDLLLTMTSAIGSNYADTMIANSVGGRLSGEGGDDVLHGGAGTDGLSGGAGDDVLTGEGNLDFMDGGEGDDVLDGGSEHDLLFGAGGADQLQGGEGDDLLAGDTGNESDIDVTPGDDVVDGGPGEDVIDFSLSATAVIVDLAAGTASGEGEDQLAAIERISGTGFDDHLTGSDGPNEILAGGGDDQLFGRAGDDVLNGQLGSDFADGGDGFDYCGDVEGAEACEDDYPNGRRKPPESPRF